MNRMSVVILWALALLVLKPALAAEPRQQPTAREQARTVTIFHQPVVMLQATFGQTTPEERVLRTRSALRAFTEDDIRQPLRVVAVNRYGQPGRLFLMNGKPVLLLSQADLDEGDDLTLDQAAQRVLARMEAQRTSLQEQFNDRYLLLSAGKALAGGLCLSKVWAQTWLFAVKREISMHLLSTPEFCNCKNGYAPQPCLFDKVVSRHIRHGSG